MTLAIRDGSVTARTSTLVLGVGLNLDGETPDGLPILSSTGGGTADADLAAHMADASDPHGIRDVGLIAYTDDPRLTDARTPTAHTHPWADVTARATTLAGYGITDAVLATDPRLSDARTPTAHTHLWADITGKPATFAPSAHTHAWGDVTGTPTTLAGYGITNAAVPGTLSVTGTSSLTGNVGVGVAAQANIRLAVGGSLAPGAGATQSAVFLSVTAAPDATTLIQGLSLSVAGGGNGGVGYTTAGARTLNIGSPVKHADQTITTAFGVYINAINSGLTNYSIFALGGLAYFADQFGIGVAPTTSARLQVRGATSVGTTQWGQLINASYSDDATTAINGLEVTGVGAAGTGPYTTGTWRLLSILNPTKGTNQTITNLVGLEIAALSGGTNTFAIRSLGTSQVSFGGELTAGANLTSALLSTTGHTGLTVRVNRANVMSNQRVLEGANGTGPGGVGRALYTL